MKPNIVLIVADDQGYGNIGYHNETMLMPRISEIAQQGVILESYYVQPICSPTRSSLMTGRYTYRLGTQATVIRADVPFGVPLDETFLAQNLADAGYHTALFGKWHLGFYQRAYTPLERGFDEHLGYYQGCVDYYTHTGGQYGGMRGGTDWHRGNETTCFSDSGNYTAELIVPEATEFLHRMKGEKPFFLYLPFHLIHAPNQVPQRYEDLYDAAYPGLVAARSAESQGLCGVCACPSHSNGANATWAQCRTVLAMAAALDESVGAVFDDLKVTKNYENTVIVYTSDNGAQGGQGGTSYPLKVRRT
jgi:arylsulfatase A-like enzyme